jgi:hypothetical protein
MKYIDKLIKDNKIMSYKLDYNIENDKTYLLRLDG